MARISEVQNNVIQVNSVIQNNSCENKLDLNDLDVPEKYRSKIEKLVLQNRDLFANKDLVLGKTDS